jgi:hypothetical protein
VPPVLRDAAQSIPTPSTSATLLPRGSLPVPRSFKTVFVERLPTDRSGDENDNPDTGRNVPQRDTSGQRVRACDPSALQQPTKGGIRDAPSDDGGDDSDEDTEHDRRFESLGYPSPACEGRHDWKEAESDPGGDERLRCKPELHAPLGTR